MQEELLLLLLLLLAGIATHVVISLCCPSPLFGITGLTALATNHMLPGA